jgi:hypothetical protein
MVAAKPSVWNVPGEKPMQRGCALCPSLGVHPAKFRKGSRAERIMADPPDNIRDDVVGCSW